MEAAASGAGWLLSVGLGEWEKERMVRCALEMLSQAAGAVLGHVGVLGQGEGS